MATQTKPMDTSAPIDLDSSETKTALVELSGKADQALLELWAARSARKKSEKASHLLRAGALLEEAARGLEQVLRFGGRV